VSDRYRTIAAPSEGLYKDKGSRFLSFAFEVDSPEQAMEQVNVFRKKYHDARHVCFAYSVGVEQPQTRAGDDGEPSGTAGRPILGQISSYGLNNVLIIVVRYFGGILLGTSGLTVAYKTAASESLAAATIVEKTLETTLTVSCDYLSINDLMKLVKEEKLPVSDPVYDQTCRFCIRCPQSDRDRLVARLEKIESLRIEHES